MQTIAAILGGLTGIYSFLIMARILITWFSRGDYGKPYELLCGITDPYLNWFRRFPVFRTASLDLSPIAAMAVLSLVNNVFRILSAYGRITVGLILAMLLQAVWSAAGFLLGFFIIALILRLIAVWFRLGGIFWNVVDAISRPILYRITRFFFRDRLVNYRTGVLAAIGTLAAAWLAGGFVVRLLGGLLVRLPL